MPRSKKDYIALHIDEDNRRHREQRRPSKLAQLLSLLGRCIPPLQCFRRPSSAQREVEELKAYIQAAAGREKKLADSYAELSEQCSKLTEEAEEQLRDAGLRLASSNNQLTLVEQENKQLAADASTSASKLSQTQQQNLSQAAEIEDLTGSLQDAVHRSEQLSEDIVVLKEDHKDELSRLAHQLSQQQSEAIKAAADHEQELRIHQTGATEKEEQLKVLQQRMETLQVSFAANSEHEKRLRAEESAKSAAELAQARLDSQQYADKAAELAAKLSDMEQQSASQAEDMRSLTARLHHAEQQNLWLAEQMAALTKNSDEKIASQAQHIAYLQGELEKLAAANQHNDAVTKGVEKLHVAPEGQLASAERDEAADPSLPGTRSSLPASGVELEEPFRSHEGWQQMVAIGKSDGWLLTASQVALGSELGRGSFGVTYRGTLAGQEVAVKCVSLQQKQETASTIYVREVGSLSRLCHPNIMQMLGAVVQPPQKCWLVVEYLSGGTLAEWIHGANGRRSLKEKLKMSLGIAKGMLALEATDPPVMHRDLKPANILLDAAGQPKVADFGLSREHLEDLAYDYTGETGSYTYMSPEMMRGDMYGPSTDVYSFAILMAEILKQKPPFEEYYITPTQIAQAAAYDDLRPKLPSSTPAAINYLLQAAWDPEPEIRPNFSFIVAQLSDLTASS